MNKANLANSNKKFLKNMVSSASPMQLIVILYEGAMQWLHMAKQELKKNSETELPNWTNFAKYVKMSQEILTHLQESLDESEQAEFTDRLFELYDFMKTRITDAHIKKDPAPLDEVIAMLKDLKASWLEAMKQSAA